jgi:PadR family transcriptional regulator PadR
MGRNKLGEFEHEVMLALLRLGGEAYSVPIVLELEERTGREIAQPAVYIAMKRLERRGLLRSRLDDRSVPETGRVRRYFELTPAGMAKLREARHTLTRLWEGVTTLLDEA